MPIKDLGFRNKNDLGKSLNLPTSPEGKSIERTGTNMQIFYSIALTVLGLIPIVLSIGTDHTGSVFCFMLAFMVAHDAMSRK